MDHRYAEEKKTLSTQQISEAIKVLAVINKKMSDMPPNMIDPQKIQEDLKFTIRLLNGARRNTEKCSWASAKTDLAFEVWLRSNTGADLEEQEEKRIDPDLEGFVKNELN
jgi:hypothetical protein